MCLIPSHGLFGSIHPADTLYVEDVHGEAIAARLEACEVHGPQAEGEGTGRSKQGEVSSRAGPELPAGQKSVILQPPPAGTFPGTWKSWSR